MPSKISSYLQTRFGSIEKGLDFFQFVGWLIALGITLLLLSPVLISPVIALMLLLFFMVGIVWMLVMRKRGTDVFSTPVDMGMVAIFVALLVTTYFAFDPSRAVRTIWQWSVLILLFYLLLALFRLGFSFYPFVKALMVVTSIFVLSGYFELIVWTVKWYTQRGWPLILPPSFVRVSGLLGNPNVLGNFLAMVLAMAITLFIEFKRYRSMRLGVWLVATAVILIATQSRGALVGVFAAFALYGLIKMWQKSKVVSFLHKQWGGVLLVIIGGSAVLILLLLLIRPTTFSTDATMSVRYELWRIALNGWKQVPWTGGGANSYPRFVLQAAKVPYGSIMFAYAAHNFFLNTLVEMGLVGFLAVLLLLAQIIWMLWKPQQWDSWTSVFFTPLVVLIAQAQVEVPWLRIIVIATLFLAALVASTTVYNKERVVQSRWHRLPYFWLFVWLILLVSGINGWQRVKLHEEGVTYAENGDWEAASGAFHAGQSLTPYADSLFLFTAGFSDGVLAVSDEAYLSSAIESQEQWVEREPGWSAHHANLAGLYRQAGRTEEAIAEMEQAIAHAPDVPLYYLNLGRWYEADGDVETAVSFYQQAYQLPHTWHDSPFWQTPTAAQAIDGVEPAHTVLYLAAEEMWAKGNEDAATQIFQSITAYEALINGRYAEALPVFQTIADQNDTADAYLGMGIAHLYAGDIDEAEFALAQAAMRSANPTIALWQAALPTAPAEALPLAAAELQHYYSVVETAPFSRYYGYALFRREPIPHDLLPQLSCFTFATNTGMHMQLLRDWYTATGDTATADYLNTLIMGAGDGLDPCTIVD